MTAEQVPESLEAIVATEPQPESEAPTDQEKAEFLRKLEVQRDIARNQLNKLPRHHLVETVLDLFAAKYLLETKLNELTELLKITTESKSEIAEGDIDV